MYDHEIEAQVKVLQDAKMIAAGPKAKQAAIGVLSERYWNTRIGIIWNLDDVKQQAKTMGIKITQDEAREVLDRVVRKFDANDGVNWSVLAYHISQVKPQKA